MNGERKKQNLKTKKIKCQNLKKEKLQGNNKDKTFI